MDELPAFVLLNETLHSVASGARRRDLLRQIRSSAQADAPRVGQARDEGDTIPSRSSSSGQLQPHAPAQVEGQARQKIKLTPWRLVNTIVILSIGLPKAVYSYLGYPVTVNTLDWALGLCWCLGAFWLSIFESEQQDRWPWFFQCDLVLPISIAQVACAMFATFFVISLSLTTPMCKRSAI
ncbi:hypothetical protein CVT26_014949 [Gymnopilus dilepis]|uniref:Uncharacterized protein n=1 Tax=Gymnopilus dilepis TaxID=231916 RepID=A0A409W3M6_9AGAR|nr:hypothetical protein CVT26_014949 [Gymnopilus dilepis]